MNGPRRWDTAAVPDAAFERDWNARLAGSRHAHFAMRIDYLAWEAGQGRPALALLVDEPQLAAAIVVRRHGSGWVAGWPWRWGCVLEGAGDDTPAGWSAAGLDRLCAITGRETRGARWRTYLPVCEGQARGHLAGSTLYTDLSPVPDALFGGIVPGKRRAIRKLEKAGWNVVHASTPEQFRAFRAMQIENDARLGRGAPADLEESPAPGEGWREWELPWHHLLLAVKDGVPHAGSGYGLLPGGTLDYRTNASTAEGRECGANALVGWTGMQWGREQGCRWLNWGGATRFKRDLGGAVVSIECRLGGGPAWALPNAAETLAIRARATVAAWIRAAKQARKQGGQA